MSFFDGFWLNTYVCIAIIAMAYSKRSTGSIPAPSRTYENTIFDSKELSGG